MYKRINPLFESQVGHATRRNLLVVVKVVKTVLVRKKLESFKRVKEPEGFEPDGYISASKAYKLIAPLDLMAASI